MDAETALIVAKNYINKGSKISNEVMDIVTERFGGQNSFYVVNFKGGGWVMVSADDSTVPIFAYSTDGAYREDDEKPDGFLYLVSEYNEQVDIVRKSKLTRSVEIVEMWNSLIINEGKSNVVSQQFVDPSTMSYVPGTNLLNISGRGEVAWGQGINNDGTCTPAYNAYAKKTSIQGWFADCGCDDRPPAGCGAVAMGQVMWYWQWPKSSSYRTYNWSLMTNSLKDGQMAQGNEIAHLLRDCGDASNMTYACAGSFTTSIEPALRNTFNYQAARKVYKSDWSFSVWNDLIRTEIDCGRPVIYYGAKALTLDKKHYFVIDGYSSIDNNKFHINFGWRGGKNGYFHLNNITPDGHNFNSSQSAIIGISPTNQPSNVNVNGVLYTSVTGVKLEEAQQNISLPSKLFGKLSVENGGNLTLVAGNSIALHQGFHAKQGSQFTAKIEQAYRNINLDVYLINRALYMSVENADSYDLSIESSGGSKYYQSASTIPSSTTVGLWNAPSNVDMFAYTLRVRNSYGLIIEKTDTISFSKLVMMNDDRLFASDAIESSINNDKLDFSVSPNPNDGNFTVKITGKIQPYTVEIFNSVGGLLGIINCNDETLNIHRTDLSSGVYFVKMKMKEETVVKKIIVQ